MSHQPHNPPTVNPSEDAELEELRQILADNPKLEPLLKLLEPAPITENIDEVRAAFASIYQTVQLQLESRFDDQFDKDVPNSLKPFIDTYGQIPKDDDRADPEAAPASNLQGITAGLTSSLPLSRALVRSSLGLQSALEQAVRGVSSPNAPLPPTPIIPLPPSPIFHDFAKDLVSKAVDFPDVKEGDGKPMKCIPALPFENWGLTVQNTPAYTFVARTQVGLQNLVVWAARQKKKVRVPGYRHTWT